MTDKYGGDDAMIVGIPPLTKTAGEVIDVVMRAKNAGRLLAFGENLDAHIDRTYPDPHYIVIMKRKE